MSTHGGTSSTLSILAYLAQPAVVGPSADELITLREAGEILDRTDSMVDNLVRNGSLKVEKTVASGKRGRGTRLVRRGDVEAIRESMNERFTQHEVMLRLALTYPEQVKTLVARGLLTAYPPLPNRFNSGQTYDKDEVRRLAAGHSSGTDEQKAKVDARWKDGAHERMQAMLDAWPRDDFAGVERSSAGGRVYRARNLSLNDSGFSAAGLPSDWQMFAAA